MHTRRFFQLLLLLLSFCASAHEFRMEPRSHSEKIYVQPEQVAFVGKHIWVHVGPENWIPVQNVSSDATGLYAVPRDIDPDDIVPGTKKCWNCAATNSLRATTCWKCGKNI